jgi:hypothetical protein
VWKLPLQERMQNERQKIMKWQPIETYDNLKNKPKNAVFVFAAEMHNRQKDKIQLPEIYEFSRKFGSRICTHWIELPELKGEK